MERDIDKTRYDCIRTQDLSFTYCLKRPAKDDISVDSKDSNMERASDWQMRTGVKMTTQDNTFTNMSNACMIELAEADSTSGKGKLAYTPYQRQHLKMALEHKT